MYNWSPEQNNRSHIFCIASAFSRVFIVWGLVLGSSLMYGYYLATSFNVVVPTFIKKSITNAQLVQFCCMEVQGSCLLFLPGCGAPRNVTILYMVYISTMLVLFLDFKRRTYSSAKAGKTSEQDPVSCCGFPWFSEKPATAGSSQARKEQ